MKKALSILLVSVFIIQILPLNIIAVEINDKKTSPNITGEVEELREEFVKHFKFDDGSYTAVVYNEPVHYEDGGEWKEVDNTLTLSKTKLSASGKKTYVNKASAMPVSIPQNLADGQKITLS
ncbi:MAG: hypothetical protein FWF05_03120, partial [Oscillospiraceae bacterium]|nr:hypothetical protein [Oscillospiraceae bacterium]